MIGEILDLPMKLVYWLSGHARAFVASKQNGPTTTEEGAVIEQPAAPTSTTSLLDLPMVAIYWLSGRLRAFVVARQNRKEAVVVEGEPSEVSEDTTPRQEGGNPLRFRPDLWALEGDAKMAMDVRPTIIRLSKPWLALIAGRVRKQAHLSFLDILFLRVEIHTDSKKLVISSRKFKGMLGISETIKLSSIMTPKSESVGGFFPSLWFEGLMGLTILSFSVKHENNPKRRYIILPRRGMWWPVSLMRPLEQHDDDGPAYEAMFGSLADWAGNGKWT